MNRAIFRHLSHKLCFPALTLLLGSAAGHAQQSTGQPAAAERSLSVAFHSEAVAKSRTGDKGDLTLHVLLPPSYATSTRRYPVIYTFHGFGDRPEDLLEALKPLLDEAVAQGTSPEYILVGVPGTNRLGGSFYVNSPATGNWEDMATQEAVALIESRFRTIPEARARGLAGYSMGGFAAWNLALAHPDRFSSAWAVCPGAFDENGLTDAMPTWDGRIKGAYGAAFSPDKNPPPYAETPSFSGTPEDQAIIARWKAGFGDIQGKLARYQAASARLQGLRFDYGERDSYRWIPNGTVFTAKAMKEAGLPVEIAAWNAGHVYSEEMLRKGFIPFFARMFQGLGHP